MFSANVVVDSRYVANLDWGEPGEGTPRRHGSISHSRNRAEFGEIAPQAERWGLLETEAAYSYARQLQS